MKTKVAEWRLPFALPRVAMFAVLLTLALSIPALGLDQQSHRTGRKRAFDRLRSSGRSSRRHHGWRPSLADGCTARPAAAAAGSDDPLHHSWQRCAGVVRGAAAPTGLLAIGGRRFCSQVRPALRCRHLPGNRACAPGNNDGVAAAIHGPTGWRNRLGRIRLVRTAPQVRAK